MLQRVIQFFSISLLVILFFSRSITLTFAAFTYTTSWTGGFSAPQGMAIDASQNIYVTDLNNNNLQKFNNTGTLLQTWTGFSAPIGVAVTSTGIIYVANSTANTISKISGGTTSTFISSGLNTPQGLAVDSSDNLYVADGADGVVKKYNSSGTLLQTIGSSGTGDGQFSKPIGLAFDTSGNLYVTDAPNLRVEKFNSSGTFVTKWGSSGTGDGQFSSSPGDGPHGVAVDNLGNVYVTDTWGNRMEKFTTSGTFVAKWGQFGTGNGDLHGPFGVVVDNTGYAYVIDYYNNRIEKFLDTDAIPPTATPTPTSTAAPSGGSTNTASAPSCGDAKPATAPNLFQVSTHGNTATLYFVPASGSNNKYYVSYGLNSDASGFGVEFPYSNTSGVIPYTINYLFPGIWYFKVRGGNGCMPGGWSGVMSVRVTGFSGNSSSMAHSNVLGAGTIASVPTGKCENYTVKSGDSLWEIASSQLGNGELFGTIEKQNNLSSSLIHAGKILKVRC